VPFVPTIASYELKKDIESLESIIIFTSVENTKNVNEIIENNEKYPKLNIKSVFVLNGSLNWWKWSKTYLNFEKFENLLIEGKNKILEKIPYFSVDPKTDIFLLLRSSSSVTDSSPKAAIISHYSFVASLTEFWKTKQFEKVIIPIISSFGEIGAHLSLANYLCSGATLVLYEEYDDELLLQSVEKYRINVLVLFPAIGQKLIEGKLSNKYDLSSVRMMFTETVAFPPNVAKELVKKYKAIFRESKSYLLPIICFFY
jgi:acyl-coenzyme A synthetase/AMP-(fatty) acid ligase